MHLHGGYTNATYPKSTVEYNGPTASLAGSTARQIRYASLDMPTGYRMKKAWYRNQCRAYGGFPPDDKPNAKYEYRIISVVAQATSIDE